MQTRLAFFPGGDGDGSALNAGPLPVHAPRDEERRVAGEIADLVPCRTAIVTVGAGRLTKSFSIIEAVLECQPELHVIAVAPDLRAATSQARRMLGEFARLRITIVDPGQGDWSMNLPRTFGPRVLVVESALLPHISELLGEKDRVVVSGPLPTPPADCQLLATWPSLDVHFLRRLVL